MIEKVLKGIIKYNIIGSEDKVLVAVSGGPDSMALLDILNKLKKQLNCEIYAAHLNHMFRGEEAESDARFVRDFCQTHGIPVSVEAINVTDYMKKTGLSSQVAARDVRYDFLNNVARSEGCNKIALGHHADDQAETILMNFMRGSGAKGLKGIELINRQYIRPLLFTRRYEIEAYCQKNNLNPILDSSNLKDIYQRNKVRHKLIPFLEQEFNPNIVEVLNQTAIIIKDEYDYIEEETNKAFDNIISNESTLNEGRKQFSFNDKMFNLLSSAIKRRLLIKIWTELTGDNRDLDFRHIEKIIKFIQVGPSNGYINLPKGYYVKKEYEEIKITNTEVEKVTSSFYKVMDIPGKVFFEELNKTIEGKVLPEKPRTPLKDNELIIDMEKVSLPLTIRNRIAGDRVKLLGMNGSKKLKDFLIDLKIPIDKRDEIPLVFDQKGMIWVAGIRQCAGYEVDERTNKYLLLTIKSKE